jgi:RNA polymerase sigma-70 factor (ECF subfamily)
MAQLNATEFEAFVKQSTGQMLAVVRRILRNDADAEDALQEALIAAWNARDSFDGRSTMSTWVHRIAVNTALNKLKQRSTQRSRIESDLEHVPNQARGISADSLALREVVWRAIDQLPDDQRVVLVLRDVEEMTSDEVADRLNLTSTAVRQRLHRARKYVAEMLTPELCGAGEMTCGGRLDLLLDMIDNMLADDVREPVLAHVKECTICQGYAAGYTRTIKLPAETAEQSTSVSTELIDRVLRQIRA